MLGNPAVAYQAKLANISGTLDADDHQRHNASDQLTPI
jgi:hypothetical protein